MRIAIISDAGPPQCNGVVRTLQSTIAELEKSGAEVLFIHPGQFPNFPMPGYSEIAVPSTTKGLRERLQEFKPEYVHISTEGRLGWAARRICLDLGWRFTTAYHTDFPSYARKHFFVPKALTFAFLRKFHSRSSGVMVSTPTIAQDLAERGFKKIRRWGRGVDTTIFHPRDRSDLAPRPVYLYVGRVSKEKNIEAFLDLALDGTKVVVGDGPSLARYQARYPDVLFRGKLSGDALGEAYSEADVFVFPSKSDTFGLVVIEAIASGTPVAAYPVQGPIDILEDQSGVMDENLEYAINEALLLDRAAVIQAGKGFTWEIATRQFVNGLVKR